MVRCLNFSGAERQSTADHNTGAAEIDGFAGRGVTAGHRCCCGSLSAVAAAHLLGVSRSAEIGWAKGPVIRPPTSVTK